jgi:hypothetical protein
MNNGPDFFRPCLVLGTGFHRWALGESMQSDFMPLLDWNELLLAVARSMRVPLDRSEHSLSLHWERLLARARQNDGFGKGVDGQPDAPAVGRLESVAKAQTAILLAELGKVYPAESQRAHFPLQSIWGAVVSLNFDAHWLGKRGLSWTSMSKDAHDLTSVRGAGMALQSELLRLNNHIVFPCVDSIARRLWFPNGFVEHPRSLRLGLREFGFQPVAIHEAFNALKEFEGGAPGNVEQRKASLGLCLRGNPL